VHGAVGGSRDLRTVRGRDLAGGDRPWHSRAQRGVGVRGPLGGSLDDDVDGRAVLWEGRGEALVRVDDGEAARQRLDAGSDVRIVSVGRARPATRAPAASVQTRGRRTTAPASRPQAPSTLPRRAARRLENGSRTASTLSPSTARSAGSTVAEARTATATTSIAPIASEVNRPPATSMPLMATMTVTPEMTTARPAVAPARPIDSVTVAPAARSSRARRSTNST
jgi:hypothetical protein